MSLVLPVIHHHNDALTLEQADLAFACGADGVFVISHYNNDDAVLKMACAIKARHPNKPVGINFLSHSGQEALCQVAGTDIDWVWDDSPGVRSDGLSDDAITLAKQLSTLPSKKLFGSVAFKYQPVDPKPGEAAVAATYLDFIPTTSGSGTGIAPEVGKIISMRQALDQLAPNQPLAIASGMTLDNIEHFAPHLTHILVATGVSLDEHHFCENTLRAFIAKVKAVS